MATTDKGVAASVDLLSPAERRLIVDALDLKAASLSRAIRAEKNPGIADLRKAEADDVARLILKFS